MSRVTLLMGVMKVKDSGTTFIVGKQYLNQTINLTKNITIAGYGNTSASIYMLSTKHEYKRTYVFNTHLDVNTKITGFIFDTLEFYNLGLLHVEHLYIESIVITRCQFYGSTVLSDGSTVSPNH